MEQTQSQHLPYPDENDPGNGALQLQVLAEAIDAKLVAEFAALRSIVNPAAIIVNLSANQTGVAASTETTIDWDQTLYSMGNWQLNPFSPFFPYTGYYRIGAYVVTNPSGAITANSSVITKLKAPYTQYVPFTTYTIDTFSTENFQSSTGGEHQIMEGLVRVDVVNQFPTNLSPNDYSGIYTTVTHTNVASTLNVIATSKMWAYKVSELEDM